MNKKNILIITQYFYPEVFKVNDIAFDFAERGYKVTVLTAIPNYPGGKYAKGYGLLKKRIEKIKGVKVIRVPVIPRRKGTGLFLFLNYISFVLTSFFPAIFFGLFSKFNAIFVHEVSPVTVGVPALIIKKIKKIPIYFWVLDLWPESLTAAGGINNKYIINGVTSLVKKIYKSSDKILISSRGFRKSIIDKGNFDKKIIYFPNWAEDIFEKPEANEEIPNLPEGFKIMYAGNIGEAQNLENIMQAALILKDFTNIKWIIIGDGRKLPWLKNFIDKHNLQETVYTLGRFPISKMPAFYQQADAMLLSLKEDPIFSITVPARIQTYMASSKPILGLINGEASEIIKEANCGLVSKSEDIDNFVDNIKTLASLSKEELLNLGKNSKKYYDNNFLRRAKLNQLSELIDN